MYIFNRIFNRLVNKVCFALMIIIIALLFFFIGLNVTHADTQRVNMNDYQQSDRFFVYNCSSSTTCTTSLDTTMQTFSSGNYYKTLYKLSSTNTIGTSGLNMVYQLNQKLMPGYMYSITSLVCHDIATVEAYSRTGLVASQTMSYPMAYTSTTRGQVSASNVFLENNGYHMGELTNYCTFYNSIVSPGTEGSWLSLHLTRPTLSSSTNVYLVGYQIEALGMYNPDLEGSITQVIETTNASTMAEIEALNDQISAMNEQQQTTNDKLDDTNEKLDELNKTQQETNDLIKDDKVDGASSTGNSFFDDFNTTDNGGISSVITMPLRLINGLLDSNNTCSTLKMTIFNKEVEIPSGCMLWDLAPDSVVAIWRTFICGASAYFLLTSLFKDIEKLKNPNNSEVSTLDL